MIHDISLHTLSILGLSLFIFSKRVLDIGFNFDVEIEVETSVAQDADLISPKTDNNTATIDGYISAFKCDGFADPFVRNDTALRPNDLLKICIESSDSDVEISYFTAMTLVQDNVETMLLINPVNLAVKDPKVTTLGYRPNKSGAIVQTVVPSRFFQVDGATTNVTGQVKVNFVSSSTRRLITFDLDASPSASFTTRSLRSKVVARPDYDSSDDVDSSTEKELVPWEEDPQVSKSVSNFGFEILMEPEPTMTNSGIEADDADELFSGDAIKSIGAVQVLAAIICFVGAFLW